MQRKLLLGACTHCNGLHNYHVTLHLHAKLVSKLRVLVWWVKSSMWQNQVIVALANCMVQKVK